MSTCNSCNSYNGSVCTLHTATFINKEGKNYSELEEVNFDHFKVIQERLKLVPPDPATFSCSSHKEKT